MTCWFLPICGCDVPIGSQASRRRTDFGLGGEGQRCWLGRPGLDRRKSKRGRGSAWTRGWHVRAVSVLHLRDTDEIGGRGRASSRPTGRSTQSDSGCISACSRRATNARTRPSSLQPRSTASRSTTCAGSTSTTPDSSSESGASCQAPQGRHRARSRGEIGRDRVTGFAAASRAHRYDVARVDWRGYQVAPPNRDRQAHGSALRPRHRGICSRPRCDACRRRAPRAAAPATQRHRAREVPPAGTARLHPRGHRARRVWPGHCDHRPLEP